MEIFGAEVFSTKSVDWGAATRVAGAKMTLIYLMMFLVLSTNGVAQFGEEDTNKDTFYISGKILVVAKKMGRPPLKNPHPDTVKRQKRRAKRKQEIQHHQQLHHLSHHPINKPTTSQEQHTQRRSGRPRGRESAATTSSSHPPPSQQATASQEQHTKRRRTTNETKDEVIEIENRLERLNKSSVKTIKAQSGDIYDCVDFYKQPAFDHPSLKNHNYNFQTKSSYRPKVMMNEKETPYKGRQASLKSGFKGKSCPIGTVPIRRHTKEELVRAKLFTKTYSSRISPLAPEAEGFHHAIVRTKSNPNKKYNGASTSASIYTLDNVTGSQYTSGQMTTQNGDDSIRVGWTVNPTLYGDHKSRLFTFFKAGGLSCFNTMCPGFVIVRTDIPLDDVLPETHPGVIPQEYDFFVYRDRTTRNWWLELGIYNIPIGYWPSSIFSSGLKDLATYIDWGGETYSPVGQPGPPMGSGLFLKGSTRYDAYCRKLTTINEAHDPEDAKNTEIVSIDTDFYVAKDWGFVGESRRLMTYGGPGPR
ncbi:protein neprosin-like [Humulus lupulus]|uniref:protein neprosin-like n=1 Tax=Humulus lupulus TaxID=3486 RepID=UPI002B41637C|nr:protein neprosin-like [Humulus lupulus]